MNKVLIGILAFALGAGTGAVVTYKLLEAKYEQRIQEETIEIREYYSKNSYEDTNDTNEDPAFDEQDVKEYEEVLKTTNYRSYSNEKPEKGGSTTRDILRPYIIRPEEFGENEEYDAITLNYYEDGVLADDITEILDDEIDDLVGSDFADHFGEYEEDSVFIKNDMNKCYYEIIRDPRLFVDVVGNA